MKLPKAENGHNNGVVNYDTGETFPAVTMIRAPYQGPMFVQVFQRAMIEIARLNLRGESRRILEYLLGILKLDNWVRLSQADIARDLGMKPSAVARALRQLMDHDIIEKGTPIGRNQVYRLCEHVGYLGRLDRYGAPKRKVLNG